jgi:hypothetical protein
VESASDPVPHEIANDGETGRLDDALHCSADIPEMISRSCSAHTRIESLACDIEKTI